MSRLQAFPGFAAWSEAELLALEAHLALQQVKQGHVFVHEGRGEPSELALFALVKGQVAVTRQDARFTLDEGALFGVVAFVDGGARSATVTAATDAEVLVLTREAWARLEPALAARLELVIARQLARDFAAMNRRAVTAFAEDTSPPPGGPTWAQVTSYSGLHAMRTELHETATVRELVAAFAAARKQGRRVVLRGSGLSFDTQAMSPDVAVTLSGFDDFTIDAEAGTLTAGAGAKWGPIVRALEPLGLMARIVASGSELTVGGTLAVNTLSRFSPVWGKEGNAVESLEVLTVSGERLTVSRTHEPELFYGCIGGFGQLAVILRATYRLMKLGTPLRVESRVERSADPSRLAPALTLEKNPDVRAQTSYAVVAFARQGEREETRSIVTRSRYVNDVPLKTLLPHRPASASRVPIELAIHHFQAMGQAFWNFAYERYLDDALTYVDELEGYTFFMDGNVRAHRAAGAMGLGFRTVQQTSVVPTAAELAPFIARARAKTLEAGLELALVDVLHLTEDEPFMLSSTNGARGYAVTFTFEGLESVAQVGRVRELFVDLATETASLGGRVHLTKNVFARASELSRMYRSGLERLVAAKRKYDPAGLLTSDFAQRLFPDLSAR